MDDRLIKFARLVETGNYTKAAQGLHISQPALSMAIDKLERELGTKLLVRSNKKLELTEAGELVYQSALEHQNVTENLKSRLVRLSKKRPQIQLGMTDSVTSMLCTTKAFEQLESATDVTIVVNNSRYLREAVIQRRLDIAFVVDDGTEHPPLISTPVGEEELLLVCHPSLKSEAVASSRVGKLDNFICYDRPSTTYRHIHRALQAAGIGTHTTLFSTSPDIMLQMVLRGKGVAALPRLMVQSYLEQGKLDRLPTTVKLPISRVELAGKLHTPVLQEFISASSL